MSLQIGRITGLNEPGTWDASGDHVVLTGSYKATSLADGLTRRAQLLGLANNPDEPVVPVLIDGESRINGFYRINSAQMLIDEFVRKQGNLYDYQIDMDRVLAFTSATCESFLTGAVMANDFTVTTLAQPWHAAPPLSQGYTIGWPATVASQNRTGEDGTNVVFWVAPAPASYKTLAKFTLLPASFYPGAAQLQSGASGSTQTPVIGLQAAPAAGDWRLTNGLLRVEGNSGLGLKVTFWNNTSWASATQHIFNFTFPGFGGLIGEESYIRILRNSPEAVVIRITLRGGGANLGSIQLDVELRRGARTVRCFLAWVNNDALTVAHSTAAACAALTAGAIQTTSFDADGVTKWILQSSKTMTQDLTNGKLTQASSTFTKADIAISSAMAGSGNAAQDLVYQYLAAVAEHMLVVGR